MADEDTYAPGMGKQASKWDATDLDRCEHGRHSIDNCFGCPDGASTGNLFLLGGRVQSDSNAEGCRVRIGTTLYGEAIVVWARRAAR